LILTKEKIEDYVAKDAEEYDCLICHREARVKIDNNYYCWAHGEAKIGVAGYIGE